MTRILFVCLGNICRSPAAEGIFRNVAHGTEIAGEFDSAGTSGWHVGEPPYPPMVAAAHGRGYDLSPLRARQFISDDFHIFDLLIAMDSDNQITMEAMRPTGNHIQIKRLLDFAPDQPIRDVPDPYYTGDFEGTLTLIEAGCQGLGKSLL